MVSKMDNKSKLIKKIKTNTSTFQVKNNPVLVLMIFL